MSRLPSIEFSAIPPLSLMLSRVNYISRALYQTSSIARAAGVLNGRTPLTITKHPNIKRDPRFQQLTEKHVDYFRTVLGENAILHDKDPEADSILQYNTDCKKPSGLMVYQPYRH